MMDAVQALVTASPNPFTISPSQGSYSVSVGASAGTHAGGGAIDISAASLTTTQRDFLVAAMRQVGWAAWLRTPAQGFSYHVHGIAVGCADLSPEAAQQVQAYFAGLNGLRGGNPDDGPRDWVGVTWETYSGSTYVPPSGGGGGGTGVRVWNQYPGDRCGAYLQAPAGILAGTPTVAFNPGFTTFSRTEIAAPFTTMTLTAGDSVMLAALEDFDYGEPVPSAGYWLVRWTGGGSLALADAYDLGYDYPSVTPTWVSRSHMGDDTEGLAYFAFDPAMLDGSHLYNDGQPLVRITCTAGTALIDFVGVQIDGPSGFWLEDGLSETSPAQPPQTQVLAAPSFDGTFDIVSGGGGPLTDTWAVDGTPVYQFEPLETGVTDTLGRQTADETSLTSAEDAVDLRNANIVTERGGVPGEVAYALYYDNGIGIFPAPENWRSTLREVPQIYTSPTMSVLPTAPPGLIPVGYLRSGSVTWLGSDTGILGWYVGPAPGGSQYVSVLGDAQVATLYVTTHNEFVDSTTFDHHSGTVVGTWEKFTDDDLNRGPITDEVQGTFEALEITTNNTLLILSLDSTIRDATDFRHVYALSSPEAEAFTGAQVSLVNVPAAPRFRIPGYTYPQPSFVQAPTWTPFIDFDEDPSVTWLRQRQRNDGLGNSITRARGISSQQRSLRQRGYR